MVIHRWPLKVNLFNLLHRCHYAISRRHPRLSGIDLAGLPLSDVRFGGCCLCAANLTMAYWHRVNCVSAQLNRAVFSRGVFDGCDFRGAHLAGAKITAANFVDCTFDGASLRDVELMGTTFQCCSFVGVNFAETNIGDAHFDDCNLDGIRGATLTSP